jgi:hypothetical protein
MTTPMTDKERHAFIRRLKGIGADGAARLPVRDASLAVIGYLRAFTEAMLADDRLIRTMAEARTRYKEFFLTQFDVTPENKREWLRESVLKNDRKMLFLAETLDGRIVGQDGFTLLGGGIFVLDGAMRWARGGHTRLFERSVIERTGLCFGALGCTLCEVELFKKNRMGIFNIEHAGFSFEAEYPLCVREENGMIVYSKTSPGCENTDERLVSMTMDKETFGKLHGDFL